MKHNSKPWIRVILALALLGLIVFGLTSSVWAADFRAGDVVVISEMGVGKRSALNEYPTQGRYGAGVVTASLSPSTGQLAAGVVANVSDRLLMVSEKGNAKAMFVRSLPKARRATQGKERAA